MTKRGDQLGPGSPPSWPEDVPHVIFLDPADARPVNPNTPEGEIRNIAAFAAAAQTATPGRRFVIKLFVWLVLIGIALGIAAGIANGLH